MRTELVEKALSLHLQSNLDLPDGLIIHRAGEKFPDRTRGWLRPRIRSVDREDRQVEVYTLDFVCYLKVLHKANRFAELSRFADQVRLVVDATERAKPVQIKNEQNVQFALMLFDNANESREFDRSVLYEGTTIPGLDLVTISVRARVQCGTC